LNVEEALISEGFNLASYAYPKLIGYAPTKTNIDEKLNYDKRKLVYSDKDIFFIDYIIIYLINILYNMTVFIKHINQTRLNINNEC